MKHINIIKLVIIILIASPIQFVFGLIMDGVKNIEDNKDNFSYYWKELLPVAWFFYRHNFKDGVSFDEWIKDNQEQKDLDREHANRMIMFFSKGDKFLSSFKKTKSLNYFNS